MEYVKNTILQAVGYPVNKRYNRKTEVPYTHCIVVEYDEPEYKPYNGILACSTSKEALKKRLKKFDTTMGKYTICELKPL